MRIIIGLGNPGEKYRQTRHNVGFQAVEQLGEKILNSKSSGWKFSKRFNAETLKLKAKSYSLKADYLLVKPQTFMNKSGLAVQKIINSYKNKTIHHSLTCLPVDKVTNHLFIVHDDLDIPLGEYKIQHGRSSAGHKGVQSIIDKLGTKDFWRIRIGIGPAKGDSQDYVLEKFSKKEKEIISRVIDKIIIELLREDRKPKAEDRS